MPAFVDSSTSSPVLIIPPMSVYQPSFGSMAPCQDDGTRIASHSAVNGQAAPLVPSTSTSFSTQSRPSASRKRSRDEAAANLNDDEAPAPISIQPIKESEEDWIYGEGMVLIKPGSGYVADASSQSGTWVEERAAEEETRKVEAEAAAAAALRQQRDRPALRSHKSQRLEQTTATSPGHEVPGNPPSPQAYPTHSGPAGIPSISSADGLAQPVVDDFTIHLGIGWRRISDDHHIQAAARGWARYIENHYPLSSVSIRLESKGLQSYLVEAAEGYFLFAENLKQGRLVSRTVEGALTNLKCSPPAFDGSETITAAETPKPMESPTDNTTDVHADVEMDLS